jgi:hypothetical protein
MLVPGKHFGFRLLVRKINNRSPDEIASNAQMTGRVQCGCAQGPQWFVAAWILGLGQRLKEPVTGCETPAHPDDLSLSQTNSGHLCLYRDKVLDAGMNRIRLNSQSIRMLRFLDVAGSQRFLKDAGGTGSLGSFPQEGLGEFAGNPLDDQGRHRDRIAAAQTQDDRS